MRDMSETLRVEDTLGRAGPGMCYAVARLHQRIFAGLTERVAPYGLTTLQFTTLSVLDRHGAPLSTSQLARRALMTPQSMSEVIHALERKGFIERNPHPNHRKTLPAALTAKGRRALAACEATVAEFEDAMLRGFTEEDQESFGQMVTQAVRNLGGGFPNDYQSKPSLR